MISSKYRIVNIHSYNDVIIIPSTPFRHRINFDQHIMFLSVKEGEGKRMKDKTDGFSARERESVKDIGQIKRKKVRK